MTWLFHKVIVLQIIKAPSHSLTRPTVDAFRPFRLISRACPVIIIVIRQMVITYYAHRDKGFKKISLTMNSWSSTLHFRYGWDSRTKVTACAARLMCAKEFVIKKILHFSYYCKYGVLVFGDDGKGPADESKKTKRVQGWLTKIMGRGFYHLQYYYFVK